MSSISRKRTLHFLSPGSKIKSTLRKFLTLQETSYIFSRESFTYILGNKSPENIPYILGNGPFLFQEVTFEARKIKNPTLKKLLIFLKIELYSPKKLNKTPLGETGCFSNH